METVTIKKAKTQLSRLIKKACEGEEIIIARGSKPVVRLVAVSSLNQDRKPGAVSYTHLDVYKRQVVRSVTVSQVR